MLDQLLCVGNIYLNMYSSAYVLCESMSELSVGPGYSHLPDESGKGHTQALDLNPI